MNEGAVLPYIPETITVHLGAPDADAANVTVPFSEYIKNVASSEIYPTWPSSALRANILAQISFALNRVYTEYYRSRGYPFDITNSTAYDQSYVNGRDIFENISTLVDELLPQYLVRDGSVAPLFAAYCDGIQVQCGGLSQWGSVDLARAGRTPYEILTYYYGDGINIVRDAPIQGAVESYPGIPLRIGSAGNDVRRMQIRLNRISRNYPSIPKIQNPDGVFDTDTENAVREFQRIFQLTQDGVVGRATWYRIGRIYTAVKRLTDLNAESVEFTEVANQFPVTLREGSTGDGVTELQFFLNFIGTFNNAVQPVSIDGIFGPLTRQSVEDFQRYEEIPVTGEVDDITWAELYRSYIAQLESLPAGYFGTETVPFPGVILRVGSRGEDVRTLQTYLSALSQAYPEIPAVTPDGIYGPQTARAAQAFQRLFGLPVTTFVGGVTWDAIAAAYRDVQGGREGSATQYGGTLR